MREGFTTGAAAAAAAKAAAAGAGGHTIPAEVSLELPIGRSLTLGINRSGRAAGGVWASVIKDGGDGPDVTTGAEIIVEVSPRREGFLIEAGEGVGIVTKEGLGLPPGDPAVTQVPRRMIEGAVSDLPGALVTIRVPGGGEIAERTLNPRLGIVGGISILGTTGIAVPWSDEAFLATIDLGIRVAAASGLKRILLSTGRRSEKAAEKRLADLPQEGFIPVGDRIGYAIGVAKNLGISGIVLSTMVGKATKIAQGMADTHISRGEVDLSVLAGIAREAGGEEDIVEAVRSANTARHAAAIAEKSGLEDFYDLLAQRAAEALCLLAGGGIEAGVIITDRDGGIRAEAGV